MLAELLNSPQGQGLLAAAFGAAASARRGAPLNTLGAGGLAGLSAFGNAQDRITQQKQDTLRQDYLTMQLGQMKRSQARDEKLRALPEQFMRSPTQTVLANGQGPTLANAAALETAQPSFDMPGWLNARMSIDPEGTLDLKSKQAKETPFGKINPADYTPESVQRFAQTGNYGALAPVRKRDIHNGQVVDLFAAQPGQRIDDLDPNKPFGMVGGQVVPNQAFQEFSLKKARAGGTNVSVNATKPFINELSGGLGKNIDAGLSAAQAATRSIQTAQALKTAVDSGKLIAGPGSSFRVMGLQLGQMLGVGGKDGAETLSNTRQAMQAMAQGELEAAQQMKGQGQITEAERAIIKRAASGDIDSMTGPEVRLLADVMERTARFKIAAHQRNVGALGQIKEAAPLLPFYQVEMPPDYQAPTQRQQTPKVRRYNPATKRIE